MKKLIILLAFAAFLIVARNNPKTDTNENPYKGAWEITYSKHVLPDTVYETNQFANPNVKLLTDKHYAFGSQSGENLILGGGGEYKFRDDTFISYPKYHSFSRLVGDSLVMKSKVEGDLWTISYSYKNDTLQFDAREIWKRIE